jgi:hypothetical protein
MAMFGVCVSIGKGATKDVSYMAAKPCFFQAVNKLVNINTKKYWGEHTSLFNSVANSKFR